MLTNSSITIGSPREQHRAGQTTTAAVTPTAPGHRTGTEPAPAAGGDEGPLSMLPDSQRTLVTLDDSSDDDVDDFFHQGHSFSQTRVSTAGPTTLQQRADAQVDQLLATLDRMQPLQALRTVVRLEIGLDDRNLRISPGGRQATQETQSTPTSSRTEFFPADTVGETSRPLKKRKRIEEPVDQPKTRQRLHSTQQGPQAPYRPPSTLPYQAPHPPLADAHFRTAYQAWEEPQNRPQNRSQYPLQYPSQYLSRYPSRYPSQYLSRYPSQDEPQFQSPDREPVRYQRPLRPVPTPGAPYGPFYPTPSIGHSFAGQPGPLAQEAIRLPGFPPQPRPPSGMVPAFADHSWSAALNPSRTGSESRSPLEKHLLTVLRFPAGTLLEVDDLKNRTPEGRGTAVMRALLATGVLSQMTDGTLLRTGFSTPVDNVMNAVDAAETGARAFAAKLWSRPTSSPLGIEPGPARGHDMVQPPTSRSQADPGEAGDRQQAYSWMPPLAEPISPATDAPPTPPVPVESLRATRGRPRKKR